MSIIIMSLSGCIEEKELSIDEVCSEAKEVYCDKLHECNDVSTELCLEVAATDNRCETSGKEIAIIKKCLEDMKSADCTYKIPDICKK